MNAPDLLDRLLEHDAWTTGRVLELAGSLTDEQLDRDFDVGHRTVRRTLVHMLRNVEVWTDLMLARPVRRPPGARTAMGELRGRLEAALGEFARTARQARDAERLNDRYVDVLDEPPRQKSYGGTILHVLTHDHLHRGEILHMLERLGLTGLIEGDVLGWESARAAGAAASSPRDRQAGPSSP